MSRIGQNIAKRRKELGLTQEELATKLGYKSKSTINKIELGINDIPQAKVKRFAEVLDVSVPYLMGIEEEIENNPVQTAELHFEMITDGDLIELYEYFKKLGPKQRKIVKDLAKSLAEAEA